MIQALQLTLLGMGMTFGAILVLIGFIYLMTFVTNLGATDAMPDSDKAEAELADQVGEGIAEMRQGEEDRRGPDRLRRRRAVAAAVAVAVATGDRVASVKPVVGPEAGAPWDAYMRSRHLSRRACYDSRKRF